MVLVGCITQMVLGREVWAVPELPIYPYAAGQRVKTLKKGLRRCIIEMGYVETKDSTDQI
jgi:hypothetical protein